jgi:RNA polymerase sigma-70 factor (ECF subfamily)
MDRGNRRTSSGVCVAHATSRAGGRTGSAMRGKDDFEDFYLGSYARLVGQLTVVTGSLEDAEDAVQEAFARASVRWGWLRNYDAPEAWVRRVALNLATSGLRRARRHLALLGRLHAHGGKPVRADDAGADRVAIEAGLGRLPLRYRQVLALHYGADLPVGQIARQLDLPVGTVKSRLARARAALGAYLVDHASDKGHDEAQEEPGHASR